jgi:hypothetical protein
MISDISTWSREPCNPSTTRSARGCHPCLRYVVPAINLAAGNVNGGVTGVAPIANGGTNGATQQAALNNIAPTPTRAGDMMYYNGSNWVALAGNNSGNAVLTENSSGVPSWAAAGSVSSVTCGTGLSGGVITTTGTCAVNYAAKSDQQTGTSTILTVNPAQQQSRDSAAKAWVSIASCAVATCTINASYNVSQVTRSGTGTYSVTFSPTAFATANYACHVSATITFVQRLTSKATSSIGVLTVSTSFTATDSDFDLVCYGRQ